MTDDQCSHCGLAECLCDHKDPAYPTLGSEQTAPWKLIMILVGFLNASFLVFNIATVHFEVFRERKCVVKHYWGKEKKVKVGEHEFTWPKNLQYGQYEVCAEKKKVWPVD